MVTMLSSSVMEWIFRQFGPMRFFKGRLWEVARLFIKNVNVILPSNLPVHFMSCISDLMNNSSNDTFQTAAVLDVFLEII